MNKEFNLTEKRIITHKGSSTDYCYFEEDVKEFIKLEESLFWDCFNDDGTFNTSKFIVGRTKLAGDKLK